MVRERGGNVGREKPGSSARGRGKDVRVGPHIGYIGGCFGLPEGLHHPLSPWSQRRDRAAEAAWGKRTSLRGFRERLLDARTVFSLVRVSRTSLLLRPDVLHATLYSLMRSYNKR